MILLCLGGALVFHLQHEHTRTASREQERLRSLARAIAVNIEHQLASASLALEGVRNEMPKWRDPAGIQAGIFHLKALTSAMPGVRTINILDAQGTLTLSNRPELLGRNLSYRDYFKTARQHPNADQLYVSPPFETMLGTFSINITRVVPGPNGEFAGIVSATLDPQYFKTLLDSVLYAPDMWDAIAHGDGTLFLMVPGRDKLHGMNLAQPGSFFSRHRESGQITTVLSGTVYSTQEKRMMAQRTLYPPQLRMDKPLVIAVSRDLDAVFQPWRHDAQILGGLYGLTVLLSLSGLHFHQRRQRKLELQAADARAIANRFSVALDHIPAYIYMKDHQHRYVYANRSTLELFGCSAEELRGSDDTRFFPPDTVARLHAIDTQVLNNGDDTAEEIVTTSPDGSLRVYWEVKTPIYDATDPQRIWGLCGISTDITERQKREIALQESEERFRSTFDAAAIGMALISLEGRFMQANDALCRILGYTESELQRIAFQDITHPDDREADLALAQELKEGTRDNYHMEKRYFHKSGRTIWIQLSRSVVRDASGHARYFIAQIQDISEQREVLDKLATQARQDYLTGLDNRRHFMEQGEIELARVQRYHNALSLFMLDIDHFKHINDTHGHKAGDVVLQMLSHLMRETLRTFDIIGRIGGEEFAVLLPETDQQQALEVAERLRQKIAATDIILNAGLPLRITVSIGVATLQQQDVNLDILLNLADMALYRAKESGRNQVCLAN